MRAPIDRMDAIFAELTPDEMPEFLGGIELFERCGVLSTEDAAAWRNRCARWIESRFGNGKAGEVNPVA